MMVHAKPALPSGHGELLVRPPFEEWPELARANRAASASWSFAIGERPFVRAALARAARSGGARARRTASGWGSTRVTAIAEGLIVASGHQPELYHTGVWAKVFLLQRLARIVGATALDLVVDTDGFDSRAG